MFFSWLDWDYRFLGGKPELKCLFHLIIWPWSLCWDRLCQVSALWSFLPQPPAIILSSLGGSHFAALTLRESRELCSPPLEKSIYIIYLEFLCTGKLSLLFLSPFHLLTCSVIYLYQNGIRAYLFYILDYNLILLYFVVKSFQLWLLGALSVFSYVSDLLPSMCGFFFSFPFWTLPDFLAL